MPGSKRGKQSRQRNAQNTEASASVESVITHSIASEAQSDADTRASAFAARAIELNDAASMTLLARVYLHGGGGGVRLDKAAARRLLERAALLDHVPAMTALADLLCDVDVDLTSTMESRAQAAVWYRRASERGDIEATYRLAKVMISVGQDVVRDSVVFSDSIPVRASSIVPRSATSPAAATPQRSFSVTPSKSIAKTPTSLRMLEVCSLLGQAAAAGHAMAAGTLAALYQNGTQVRACPSHVEQ
jgi:TPR repeat protein